jgi:hypothetical protein
VFPASPVARTLFQTDWETPPAIEEPSQPDQLNINDADATNLVFGA